MDRGTFKSALVVPSSYTAIGRDISKSVIFSPFFERAIDRDTTKRSLAWIVPFRSGLLAGTLVSVLVVPFQFTAIGRDI